MRTSCSVDNLQVESTADADFLDNVADCASVDGAEQADDDDAVVVVVVDDNHCNFRTLDLFDRSANHAAREAEACAVDKAVDEADAA